MSSLSSRSILAVSFSLCLAASIQSQCFETGFGSPAAGELGFDGGRIADWIEFDAGSGPELYAAGSFTNAGGTPVRGIARWTGSGWADVGGGVQAAGGARGSIAAMVVHDDGSGPALFVAGRFDDVGGIPARNVARWDGSSWTDVGFGVGGGTRGVGACFGIESFDDGNGAKLYVSGNFTTCGVADVACSNLAAWDGTNWADVGGGIVGPFGGCCTYGLRSFDDGSGPALFIGCDPGTAGGGVPAQGIVKWDGNRFLQLGSGLTDGPFNFASLMIPWSDSSGPVLVVGGDFAVAGGVVCNHIATWNGVGWSNLGSGVTGTMFPYAGNGLALHDSGNGVELCVSGLFDRAGGVATEYLARWNGRDWLGMRGGVTGTGFVSGGAFHSQPGRLWVAGGFSHAGGLESSNVAVWSGNCPELSADTVAIATSEGGTQQLSIDFGQTWGGASYFVLGSASGTGPGVLLGQVRIPLNIDFYTDLAPSFLVRGSGRLDAAGRGQAFVSLLPGALTVGGFQLDHAAVAIRGGGLTASNPVRVELR